MTSGTGHRSSGLFITFEGPDGSGKSTQLGLLVERLRGMGVPVTESQEPGGTTIGKQIRRILLDPGNCEMAPQTELFLMFASRAQAAAELIEPALKRGEVVVSDRFTDSSLAYQGLGRGLGFETVMAAHRLAVGSLLPDLTICVMIDLETGLARAHGRNRDCAEHQSEARLDRQSVDFHRRASDGYREIAAAEPHRFRMVNGWGEPAIVAERVWNEVAPRLANLQVGVTR